MTLRHMGEKSERARSFPLLLNRGEDEGEESKSSFMCLR
jgi:hypothetical protein